MKKKDILPSGGNKDMSKENENMNKENEENEDMSKENENMNKENEENEDMSEENEDMSQIPQEEIADFLDEHLTALRKVAYAAGWREMVYYLEMASIIARDGMEDNVN